MNKIRRNQINKVRHDMQELYKSVNSFTDWALTGTHSLIEELATRLQDILDEEQDYLDCKPAGFEDSAEYEQVQETLDVLQEATDMLDELSALDAEDFDTEELIQKLDMLEDWLVMAAE